MAKQDVELRFSLIDGVTRSLTAIQQGVTGLGASIVKVNQAAELTGRAFGALGAVAGALGGAVSGAASVEDALARISIRTQGTIEEQQALQAAIQAAVQGTRFSAEEAANALLLLVEDGASASEAIDALGSVLGFAQAGAQSAAQATAALGAVLDAFGEKPAVIGDLADALQATAVAAQTSTQALQEGLAGVGVQAEQAGLTLNETIAALGVLATRGIEGGAAAKALNTALAALTNPASSAGKALADAGLESKSFSETLAALSRDSTAAEAVLSTLGAKPRAALRLLLNEGGADLKAFAATINDSAGASEKAAETLNTTFNGALARIQNQLGLLRNELLTPILQPIAQEVEALSGKLREFADSPQFDLLVQQFSKFASDGVKAIGDFIAGFDFAEALGAVQQFAVDAKAAFDQFYEALQIVANGIIATRDGIAKAFEYIKGLADQIAEVYRRFTTDFEPGLVTVDGRLRQVGESASWAGTRIGGLGRDAGDGKKRLNDLGGAAADAGNKVGDAGNKSRDAAAGVAALGDEAKKTGDALNNVPEAPRIALAIESTKKSAGDAALSLNQLEDQLRKVREQIDRTSPTDPKFQALAKQSGELEAQIAKLKGKIDEASASTDGLAASSERASGSLRSFGASADSAAGSAERLSQSNSEVRESFGNIGAAASSVEISLGNINEQFARQALEAAGAAGTIRGYLRTLNQFTEESARQQRAVEQRTEAQRRMTASMSEEEQILQRLQQQYPAVARDALKPLADAELALAKARERKNAATQTSLDLETKAAAAANKTAGGLNFGGSGNGAGGGGSNGQSTQPAAGGGAIINVTINGLPTDRASWEDVVREQVEPVLQRLAVRAR